LSESSYEAALRAEGLVPYSWSNGPGDRYEPHSHGYDKVLVAVAGSITFLLSERSRDRDVVLEMGDRLELPAGTVHGATVGSRGVTCLEAHLAAGTLATEPRLLPATD